MGTLATAFALAGIAVIAYCCWLAREQHRLGERLDALEAKAGDEAPCQSQSRAA